MTRRALFATVGAALAGRKIAPIAPPGGVFTGSITASQIRAGTITCSYIDYRHLQVEEIARIFGVPPVHLGSMLESIARTTCRDFKRKMGLAGNAGTPTPSQPHEDRNEFTRALPSPRVLNVSGLNLKARPVSNPKACPTDPD